MREDDGEWRVWGSECGCGEVGVSLRRRVWVCGGMWDVGVGVGGGCGFGCGYAPVQN